MAGDDFFQPHPDGFVLKVFVLPRSSKTMLVGRHGDALKIKLTAPPVEGAANTLCLKFLARRLGLPRSSLEIVSGHAGRTKLILVRADKGKPGRSHRDLEKRIKAMAGL